MTGVVKRLGDVIGVASALIFMATFLIQLAVQWGKLPPPWSPGLNDVVKFGSMGVFALSRGLNLLAPRLVDAEGSRRRGVILGVIGVFFVSMIAVGLAVG